VPVAPTETTKIQPTQTNPTTTQTNPTKKQRFIRIDPTLATYADNRLADNSFTAKSGAAGSYGERAHRDLAPTKGRDFRQEKNKKKKGGYRGGHIDMGVHSIQFPSSDGE
jgi:hypothetical protein